VAAWARAGQLRGAISQGTFTGDSPFARIPHASPRSPS